MCEWLRTCLCQLPSAFWLCKWGCILARFNVTWHLVAKDVKVANTKARQRKAVHCNGKKRRPAQKLTHHASLGGGTTRRELHLSAFSAILQNHRLSFIAQEERLPAHIFHNGVAATSTRQEATRYGPHDGGVLSLPKLIHTRQIFKHNTPTTRTRCSK